MKYSLRSLMIVVTLICVALGAIGGRIEYLRRMAVFHETEMLRLIQEYERERSEEVSLSISSHESVAFRYRKAIYRPWSMVDGSPGLRYFMDEERGISEWRRGTWDGDSIIWQKTEYP